MTPPAARLVAERAQPATTADPVGVEQARTAEGILDRFVHSNDPDQVHGFNVFVREVFPDEAGHFGVRCGQLALVGLGTNLLRDPIVVLEEHALEDGDLGGDTGGRLEIRRAEHAFSVVAQTEALVLETLDPLGTSRAVGCNAEVDDAVLFTPVASRFRNRELSLALEELDCAVMATEFLDDGVQLAGRKVGRCEFSTHGFISLPLVGHFRFPLIRGGTMNRYGHSEERPRIEPLFAMTNSQFLSKNYVSIIHPYCILVNTNVPITR
jgi:hypothetical protein